MEGLEPPIINPRKANMVWLLNLTHLATSYTIVIFFTFSYFSICFTLLFSGDIGGQLGLFLGTSILTYIEFFDLLAMYIYTKYFEIFKQKPMIWLILVNGRNIFGLNHNQVIFLCITRWFMIYIQNVNKRQVCHKQNYSSCWIGLKLD